MTSGRQAGGKWGSSTKSCGLRHSQRIGKQAYRQQSKPRDTSEIMRPGMQPFQRNKNPTQVNPVLEKSYIGVKTSFTTSKTIWGGMPWYTHFSRHAHDDIVKTRAGKFIFLRMLSAVCLCQTWHVVAKRLQPSGRAYMMACKNPTH